MKKKISALLIAAAMALSFAGCSDSDDSKSSKTDSESSASETTESADEENSAEETKAEETEPETEAPTPEPTTVHVSPVETVSASVGAQVTLDKTIQRTEGSNTLSIPLSDFIQDGDVVNSFTFVIYSDSGANIGTFKGGCGISVNADCAAATDEGWYQSADFTAQTEGAYGEIVWNVPSEISSYISAGGEVLFGYWWGGAESIRVAEVV